MARFLFWRARRATFVVCLAFGIATVPSLQAQTAPSPSAHLTNDTRTKTPPYDVVSIKPDKSDNRFSGMKNLPDGFVWSNVHLYSLVYTAYDIIMDGQVSGLPEWARSDFYDIEAKVDADTAVSWKNLSPKARWVQQIPMMQSILADRCQFRAHQEIKELPVYDLVIAKNGLKMKEAPPDEPSTERMTAAGTMIAHAMPIDNAIVYAFPNEVGRMIVDKTGLAGKKFDFELKWTPEDRRDADTAADAGPSLFTALEEQLGLKLVPSKAPVEVLIIDHMEKPSAN